ncbi:MAG: response regulator [Betaproteobacteria bacterium]|nr:response regulator [Betaproteobacteria bacterium]
MGVLAVLRLVMAFAWPVPLSVDEAQYLVWSREFQWGYYSKPPVIAWMLGVGAAVCPTSLMGVEGCTRWLQPVAMAGAGLGVALCAHALFGRLRITAWSLVLFLTMPLVGFYAQVASTDAWLLFFWSMGLYAFIRANERPAVHIRGVPAPVGGRVLEWWVLVGVCAGLGLLTKYSMAAFVVSAFLFLLMERQLMRPGPWIAASVAFVVFAPNLAWNAHWGFPTFGHHADILVHDAPIGEGIEGLLSFFGAQWLLFGPILFGMLWFGTARKLLRDAAGVRTPVIVLTALGTVPNKLDGFEAGADDYLVKPFAVDELLARIEAVHRRTANKPAMELQAGELHLSLATKRLTLDGRVVELTPTEFSILELLMRYNGQVVTRKMLCEHVWGFDWDGPTNVIEVHINRLRGKLDRGRQDSRIHTVRGRGYALAAA